MCAVSAIGDDYSLKIPNWPGVNPNWPVGPVTHPQVSREEFEQLKKLVEEMRDDLKRAKQQDIEEGNPDCEMEEKVALLQKIAAAVGVSLEDVFAK